MKTKHKILFVKIIFNQILIVKKIKTLKPFELAHYLYNEHRYAHNDLFKKLGYDIYNIDNLKKIENVNKFIHSMQDGTTDILVAK